MLQQRHLLGLEGYPAEDIQTIIDTGFKFREVLDRPIKKVPSLQGVTIVNLFFENSTRTRISFELAQKRLNADTVNFSATSGIDRVSSSIVNSLDISSLPSRASFRVTRPLPPSSINCLDPDVSSGFLLISNVVVTVVTSSPISTCNRVLSIPKTGT